MKWIKSFLSRTFFLTLNLILISILILMAVLFLLAFGSTLGRSFCGYLWSSWAPFRILVLHFSLVLPPGPLSLVPPLAFWVAFLGQLSVFSITLYILHIMISDGRPIGFTANKFLALAAAQVSAPTQWVTCFMNSLQFAARRKFCSQHST